MVEINSKKILKGLLLLLFVTFLLPASNAFGVIATVTASNDTTIYQGPVPDDVDGLADNNSCGAGSNIIAGTTDIGKNGGAFPRRALLKFNVGGQIAPGSIINSVTLTMEINRSGDTVDNEMSLYPLTVDWGEGIVNCDAQAGQGLEAAAGDATWLSAMHDGAPAWTTPGGDIGAESARALLPNRGTALWDSSTSPTNQGMVNDVQNWVDSPATNFGWIVKATNEITNNTARRFGSREGGPAPVLTIDYTPSGPVEECCDVDGNFNGTCSLVPAGTCLNPPPVPNADPTCSPNPCPQPVGACCNADESCSDLVTGAECLASGGFFNGDSSQCSDNNVNCGLEPFVDPLPWPVPEVQPISGELGGFAEYEITMDEVRQQLHRDLSATTVWGYQGSFPGPTLETTVGKPISVKFINNLPTTGHYLTVDTCPHGPNYWRDSALTSVHLHGGHVPSRFDGQPELTFFPGEFDIYEYPNDQEASTLWYHDHALGITRLNVYMGLAGYYLIRPDCAVTQNDPECNGSLPPKSYEVPAVIQDRSFDERDQLLYPSRIAGGGFFGDKILVNGKVWPYLNVDQGKYRFRLLNGSQARNYTLRLENLADPEQVIPFTLIGTDGGLIDAPIDLTSIHMVSAERFDVVIDFAGFPAGTEIVLRNDDADSPRIPNVMKFIVQGQPGYTTPLPASLKPVDPIPENDAVTTRYWNLINVSEQCAGGEWLIQSIDGPDPATANVIGEHWDDIDAYPVLGTTEIWEFINESNMMHPMHVHLVMFQILDRCPVGGGTCETLAPHEAGTWKDTVRVPPGTRVRVIMRFESYQGKFPAHCHLLDHEDHEMMRQFQTTSGICDNDGQCEFGEDGITCADCGYPADPNAPQVPGNFCGNGLCETGDGEDFFSCPADCAGSDKGKNQFNCGSDDPADPGYKCGFEISDVSGKPIFNRVLFDGCITNDYFCRVAPRVIATCGDQLCEGQEQVMGNIPDTYCAVDCEAPQPCTRNAPTFTMDADQTIAPDGQAVYTLSISNNDSATCSDSTFNLSILDETGNTNSFVLPSVLSAAQVTLSPQTSDFSTTLTVSGDGSGVDGDFLDTTVEARDDTHHLGQQQLDTVRTTIQVGQANCDGLDRNTCRNTPGCEWSGNKNNGMCVPVSAGECIDNDQDGYGNPGDPSCPNGAATDCDDNDPAVNPGAIEGPTGDATCSDLKDNDCDGLTDADDPDCQQQQVNCPAIPDRDVCKSEPTCDWTGGKNGTCDYATP
jgi:spore coat protein A